MTLLRWLALIFALCAAAAAGSAPTPGAPTQASTQIDRQILVMVRHPPAHYRPNGSYGSGYGDELARSARQRLGRSIARRFGLLFVDEYPMPLIGVDCLVMAIPDSRSTAAVVEQVSHHSRVEWSQPLEIYQTKGVAASHNDPLYRTQPVARQWALAELHRLATGRGVRIAVIDSGIDAGHPDLAGQLSINRNFVAGRQAATEQHGTHVAGIIVARADNGLGIAGVAPGARLLGLRACWQSSRSPTSPSLCDSLSLAKAINFAIEQKTDVINLSLTGPDDRLLRRLLKSALDRGSVIVAAFDTGREDGGFPASVPGVVAVSDEALASSRGQVYTAPGRDVPTTQPGGRWSLVNGSSYAAAHVSGLLALVQQLRGSTVPHLVSERAGGGAIDACATLVGTVRGCGDCSCTSSQIAQTRSSR